METINHGVVFINAQDVAEGFTQLALLRDVEFSRVVPRLLNVQVVANRCPLELTIRNDSLEAEGGVSVIVDRLGHERPGNPEVLSVPRRNELGLDFAWCRHLNSPLGLLWTDSHYLAVSPRFVTATTVEIAGDSLLG